MAINLSKKHRIFLALFVLYCTAHCSNAVAIDKSVDSYDDEERTSDDDIENDTSGDYEFRAEIETPSIDQSAQEEEVNEAREDYSLNQQFNGTENDPYNANYNSNYMAENNAGADAHDENYYADNLTPLPDVVHGSLLGEAVTERGMGCQCPF